MDYSFCELRAKDVINIVDGRRLGHIADMVFNIKRGIVCGLILPVSRGLFFRNSEDIYIPFKDILRIGEDVILVELFLPHGAKPFKKPFFGGNVGT